MIRSKYKGPADPIDRFMEKVQIVSESGCWIWTGSIGKAGYGTFNAGGGTYKSAHRWSYLHYKGKIPEKMDVCHKCDVRSCVNPHHLFIGTRRDNMIDASQKGRISRKGGNRGEFHHLSKLNEMAVRQIRSEYTGSYGQLKQLAARFSVSSNTILRAFNGETWRNIK